MKDKEIKDMMWDAWSHVAHDLISCCGGEDQIHRDDLLDTIVTVFSTEYGIDMSDELTDRIEKLIPIVFKTEYGPW